jgi:DNA-directed RNA polymerase I subunit RPA12
MATTTAQLLKDLFCRYCGSLLDMPITGSIAKCPLCRADRDMTGAVFPVFTTRSGPEDFTRRHGIEPVIMAPTDAANAAEASDLRERARVKESCPSCNNEEMEYYTMQLRSADEGQTVFYECPKCRYKYSLNT